MARDPFLENAIMEVLWDVGEPMTPAMVRDALPPERKVTYTTVMTVLTRLWKKGRLTREKAGRAYTYAPTATRSEHAAERMEEILDTAGDRAVALARFTEYLSASERRKLKEYLDGS